MKIMRGVLMLIVLFAFFKFTNAWTGLVAQNSDYLNILKWNELVVLVNTKLTETDIKAGSNISITSSGSEITIHSSGELVAINADREDSNLSLTRYYGTEYNDNSWKIDKETGSGTGTTRVTATNLNNATYSNNYSGAWVSKTSLNY